MCFVPVSDFAFTLLFAFADQHKSIAVKVVCWRLGMKSFSKLREVTHDYVYVVINIGLEPMLRLDYCHG